MPNHIPQPDDELDFLVRVLTGEAPDFQEVCDERSERRQTQQEHRDRYREEMS